MKPIRPRRIEPGSDGPSVVAFSTFAHNVTRRYIAPPIVLSLAVAAASLASFLPLVMSLRGEWGAMLDSLTERFLGNGFSRGIVFLFLASMVYGGLQLIGIVVDRERLRLMTCPAREARASWFACLAGRPLRPHTGVPIQQLGGVPGDPHDNADRYSVQRSRFTELGLLPLRFSVWVLPLLGFIGTVVGIAGSITGLEAVIAPGIGGQTTEGLVAVLGGLQFAFDTTLLGLITVIPVMLLQMILGGREGQVTEEGHQHVLALLAPVARDEELHPAGLSATPLPSSPPDGAPEEN
ncbi:MAG: MotA/TolQ/ExbB proton channel family protein [Candidatus Tectomicrobia bacterium]|nr:MotA/TolQ/ExbB proton channel family protein [Candidatus Tectomicrobia bacterium]